MLNRLRRKFIAINIACVTIILALVYAAICIVTYRTERENILRELHVAADNIIFKENQSGDESLFDEDEAPFPTLTYFVGADGKISETYTGTEPSEAKPLLSTVAEKIANKNKSEGILFDYSLVYAMGNSGGRDYVSITSLEILTENSRTITRIAGMILFGCLILFFALSYFLASVAIKPVKETWEGQKQFIADSSHDMKTPLTVILANTEIINSHGGDSVDSVTKWLDSTKAEAERMRRLVDSMLELSSTEMQESRILLSDTSLSDVTERTVLQMEAVAFEKSVSIESKITPGITIKGNEDKLSRLLHILIDNGIKYSLPSSKLIVTLSRGRRYARLCVTNLGSYINEEDLPHLFERFYRGDKARSGGKGFGLGLAIAKNLASGMGGNIRAENKDGVGATFTVGFPMSERLLQKIFYQLRSGKKT